MHGTENVTQALVDARKEIVLEVNADKTKYVVMSREDIAEQNHCVIFGNKSFENLENLKYLGSTLKN